MEKIGIIASVVMAFLGVANFNLDNFKIFDFGYDSLISSQSVEELKNLAGGDSSSFLAAIDVDKLKEAYVPKSRNSINSNSFEEDLEKISTRLAKEQAQRDKEGLEELIRDTQGKADSSLICSQNEGNIQYSVKTCHFLNEIPEYEVISSSDLILGEDEIPRGNVNLVSNNFFESEYVGVQDFECKLVSESGKSYGDFDIKDEGFGKAVDSVGDLRTYRRMVFELPSKLQEYSNQSYSLICSKKNIYGKSFSANNIVPGNDKI